MALVKLLRTCAGDSLSGNIKRLLPRRVCFTPQNGTRVTNKYEKNKENTTLGRARLTGATAAV